MIALVLFPLASNDSTLLGCCCLVMTDDHKTNKIFSLSFFIFELSSMYNIR